MPTYEAETRVDSASYIDQLSPSQGTGYAVEDSTRSVAVDDSGDFAVVWDAGDAATGTGEDVYMRIVEPEQSSV